MRCFSVFSFLELIWKLLQSKKQNKIVSTRIGTFLPHWQDRIGQPSFSVYTGHRNSSEFCFKIRFDFTTYHFFSMFCFAPRNKRQNEQSNWECSASVVSRRRCFVHRILTNHSEDHDKLIISWANVFWPTVYVSLKLKWKLISSCQHKEKI